MHHEYSNTKLRNAYKSSYRYFHKKVSPCLKIKETNTLFSSPHSCMSSHHRSHIRIYVSVQSRIRRRRRNKTEGKIKNGNQGIDDEIARLAIMFSFFLHTLLPCMSASCSFLNSFICMYVSICL